MRTGPNRLKLQALLISIRSSLWFLPLLAVLASAGLAVLLIEADRLYGETLHRWWPRFFSTEAEGARSMLSAIAGSIATIAGVAFSITIVALVLASTQYTSRVLRTFMRDRATQVVLGVFVGVYIYCLLVLRSLTGSKGEFVPPLAVLGGLVLALISVGFFIFFIHHISSSIQASEIAAAITRETLGVVNHAFPDRCSGEEDEGLPSQFDKLNWQPIPTHVMGYIQTVDIESMAAFAREHDVILQMKCSVGDFVAPHLPMFSFSGPQSFRETAVQSLHQFYSVDTYRTIEQDPGFGIRQLVDIALKALSPGINDTTTAVTCIQHLSAILVQIGQHRMPSPMHYDEQGKLRFISKEPDFEQFTALSFNQILENAEGNTEILSRLLEAIGQIAPAAVLPARKAALKHWTDTVEEVALRSAKSSYAKEQIERHVSHARALLSSDVKQ
jgi:uncharacterized membrane protein